MHPHVPVYIRSPRQFEKAKFSSYQLRVKAKAFESKTNKLKYLTTLKIQIVCFALFCIIFLCLWEAKIHNSKLQLLSLPAYVLASNIFVNVGI
jgi:hypothetical protein